MKKINSLINRYSLSKTLRFQLIPVGKTEETFVAQRCLEIDEKRSKDYKAVKKVMDRVHRAFIEQALSDITLKGLSEYASLYYASEKSDTDKKRMVSLADELRGQISKAFLRHESFKTLRPKEMVDSGLPDFIQSSDEADQLKNFKGFSSYFSGFSDARQNLYSSEEKFGSVGHRCITENLPRFLDNVYNFAIIDGILPAAALTALATDYSALFDEDISFYFTLDNFDRFLTQSGIDRYNTVIGGYSTSDNVKVKGINEYVNEYNQTAPRHSRLPLLVPLYNQMLCESKSVSFVPDKFNTDTEVLEALAVFCIGKNESDMNLLSVVDAVQSLFATLPQQDLSRIYVKSGPAISNLSNSLCGSWDAIQNAWYRQYDAEHMKKPPRDVYKYTKARAAAFKKISSFSLSDLQALCNRSMDKPRDVVNHFVNSVAEAHTKFRLCYTAAQNLLLHPYNEKTRLSQNSDAIARMKNLLDSIKDFERQITPLLDISADAEKGEFFYSQLRSLYDTISKVNNLYNKVRNYITQKPYSDEKIKLNFGNPNFLGGWSTGHETDYSCLLFRSGNSIFLGIIDKGHKSDFKSYPAPVDEEDFFERMEYRQMASPAKDIPSLLVIDGQTQRRIGKKEKSGPHAGENLLLEEMKNQYLPPEINRIRKSKSYSISNENFSKADLIAYIDYYKDRVAEYYTAFDFSFKPSEEYANFADFTNHVNSQAYQIKFIPVSKKHIDSLVASGALYLFRLYNKDMSTYSRGRPNLHTMYFRMLFDERNLANVVYKLNGGAEMFYRKASITENNKIVHPANQAIQNKNPLNQKKESTFTYDLVKDKRYTEHRFMLHLPITLNFNAEGVKNINPDVRKALCAAEGINIIGISRGEDNLLYICVIDEKGEVLEQQSINIVDSGTAEASYNRDYMALLTRLDEEKRDSQRAWQSGHTSKQAKTGYLSQVVHKICRLVVKYDAIIAMEDMNHSHNKGKYQLQNDVYKAFEKMLIDKLNYFVMKDADISAPGGLLNAYQLTNKFESFQKLGRQNGIIFYVGPGMTSNLDPTTGFIDFLRPRYTNEAAAREFISLFEDIRYNCHEDHFEFSFDYDAFYGSDLNSRKNWVVCTHGKRISMNRARCKNTGNYYDVDVTEEMKVLLKEKEIDYTAGNLVNVIADQSGREFFSNFLRLLALTLQMRNFDGSSSYFISPVRGSGGTFFDSRKYKENAQLPCAADSVTAYNMARKALMSVKMLRNASIDTLAKTNLFISYEDWLRFVQD